ncbi:MAG TPA: DUF1844 domain-containing protein [Thermoanaerobaculia bacterium]
MTEEDRPIRVVDRRMFTPEGELRPGFEADEKDEKEEPAKAAPPAPPPPAPPTAGAARASGKRPEPPPEPHPIGEEGGFLEILRSLGTTAYAALGLVPDPSGSRRRDPAVARQMIDWLAVLEQKTRGNLSFEESDMLARILYELRMAYVEVMRPPAGEPGR